MSKKEATMKEKLPETSLGRNLERNRGYFEAKMYNYFPSFYAILFSIVIYTSALPRARQNFPKQWHKIATGLTEMSIIPRQVQVNMKTKCQYPRIYTYNF